MASQTDQPRPPSAQPTTQLEFYQAMNDFKTMFPEMDEDVIEAVLRSNNGAVDVTIDQLLAMTTDIENEKIRTDQPDKIEITMTPEPPSYSPGTPPPPYRQVMYSSLDSPSNQPHTPVSSRRTVTSSTPSPTKHDFSEPPISESPPTQAQDTPLRIIKNWKPPLLGPLPESFLRIPTHHSRRRHRKVVLNAEILKQKMQENERQRLLEGSDDPELLRYLEDERIALLLQNEEFVTELKRNKDFMSTLERDSKNKSISQATSQAPEALSKFETVPEENPPDESLDAFPYTKTLPHDPESDAAFKEKLRNMGKVSRRKFTQLAKMFSRRKKRNAKGILGEGSAISQDNLLLDEEEMTDESGHESEEERELNPIFEPLPETNTIEPRARSHNTSKKRFSNKYDMI